MPEIFALHADRLRDAYERGHAAADAVQAEWEAAAERAAESRLSDEIALVEAVAGRRLDWVVSAPLRDSGRTTHAPLHNGADSDSIRRRTSRVIWSCANRIGNAEYRKRSRRGCWVCSSVTVARSCAFKRSRMSFGIVTWPFL